MSFKYKYQFTILNSNDRVTNTAATKAVIDCANILEKLGYQNFTITANSEKEGPLKFYSKAFISICKMLLKVKRGSLIAVQYPMLNNVFKYFVSAAKLKNIKFFCIIHDIESLRLGGSDSILVKSEIENLSCYDAIIVHNDRMMAWLKQNGFDKKMFSLHLFDYLTNASDLKSTQNVITNTVVYAGNLSKSTFIYNLGRLENIKFNFYGPHYLSGNDVENGTWRGVYSPNEILSQLEGDFGLIWDGNSIEHLDEIMGNYLYYNNPHKASLYLAAGLPLIAHKNAAIAQLIEHYDVGLLISNLMELDKLEITVDSYNRCKNNCLNLREKVIRGGFLTDAVRLLEQGSF